VKKYRRIEGLGEQAINQFMRDATAELSRIRSTV
jgi:hypothetical protein